MRTVVAEGVWCSNCERFEVEDLDGDRCMACGCPQSSHVDVEIVTK